jgi:hypothetical protein
MKKTWHFGDRMCAQCKYAKVLHKGCIHTSAEFKVKNEERSDDVPRPVGASSFGRQAG